MNGEKKKLTFWQSIENFWYYYKWRVISAVLILFAAVLFIDFLKLNTDDTAGDLSVVSVFAHPLTSENFDLDKRLTITEDINGDGAKTVRLAPYYITEKRTNDSDLISEAQFEGVLKVADGDLLLFDGPNLNFYLKKDIFCPIENYVDLSVIPGEDIILKDGVAVAVKLTDSKILKDMGFIIDEVYAAVMFIPDNPSDVTLASRNLTKDAIKQLLEKKGFVHNTNPF